jgi:hypothetical protein
MSLMEELIKIVGAEKFSDRTEELEAYSNDHSLINGAKTGWNCS